MRCVRCKRPLITPAAEARTRAGVVAWGPKCAIMAGLIERRRRARKVKPEPTTDDADQMALEFAQ